MTRNWGYPQLGPNFLHIPDPNTQTRPARHREHFKVNKARTESYRMSAVPYMQRKLNHYVLMQTMHTRL